MVASLELKSIHQFLPVLAWNDAIGRTVLETKKVVKEWGYDSEIYVEKPIEQTCKITKRFTDYKPKKTDLIIYHHSIGSSLSKFTSKLNIPKILFYHNITYPEFFEPYNKTISAELYAGRQQTKELANYFEFAMAGSGYNKYDLHSCGFKNVLDMQYFLDLERFHSVESKKEIINRYSDTTNILFVGRKSPNKKIEDILKTFAYYKILNSKSKLFILGGSWSVENYAEELQQLQNDLHIKNGDVISINTLSDTELASYYKIADFFLCMSEHEGFCIPLVESMYFGVPIIAYNSSAVPDTLGDSGVLVNHKNFGEIAEILNMINNDGRLRNKIISKQKERYQFFNTETAKKLLKQNIELVYNNSTSSE